MGSISPVRLIFDDKAAAGEVSDMGIGQLRDLVGEWQLAVDLPGAENVRGHAMFETVGELLVQRTTAPVPERLTAAALWSPVLTAATCSTTSTREASRGSTR